MHIGYASLADMQAWAAQIMSTAGDNGELVGNGCGEFA